MRVSVAICTWNRSALLRQTLGSLVGVRVPPAVTCEILVVANGCTDGTAEVVADAATRLPIRLVQEPRLGLSHARNAAVGAVTGDYVIWTDDDVLVDPQWIEAYCDAFATHPDAAFFGGPTRAWFATAPPRWLDRALGSVGNALSLLDYGPVAIPLDREHLPYGANFAVRTDVQRGIAYNAELGRRGSELRSGEETAVILEIIAQGGTGWWVPGAGLQHFVSPERQTLDYLRRYYFYNGAAAQRVEAARDTPLLFGRPRWLWRVAATHWLHFLVTRPFGRPEVWAWHFRHAMTALGQLHAGASDRRRGEPTDPNENGPGVE